MRNVKGHILLPSIGESQLFSWLNEFHLTFCRYIMSMAVSDYTGQAWLQGFNEVGVAVFDMPADPLVELRVRTFIYSLVHLVLLVDLRLAGQ